MRTKLSLIAAALLGGILFYGCEKWDDNGPHGKPVADFTYTIDQASHTVMFTNKSTHAKDYEWNFGDNTTSTTESPQHTYPGGGQYTVVLKASSEGHCGHGHSNSASQILVLNNTN